MKLQVTSKREGFRRGGRAWSEIPTVVDAREFTKEQLAQIRAENLLTVVELPDNPPAEGQETKGKGKGKVE